MFARQAGYLRTVREQGFRLLDGYDDHADAFHRVRARARGRAPRRPCRATTTCWPATSSTTASRCWLIDYEYSGNNDACFELGNTATECDLDDDQVEALRRGVLRARRPRTGWPGCGCRRWCRRTAGRCGARSRPRASTLDFDFDAWGRERFEKAARGFTSAAGFESLLEEVARDD